MKTKTTILAPKIRLVREYEDIHTGDRICELSFTATVGSGDKVTTQRKSIYVPRGDIASPDTVKLLGNKGLIMDAVSIQKRLVEISSEAPESLFRTSSLSGYFERNLLTRAATEDLQIFARNGEAILPTPNTKRPHSITPIRSGTADEFLRELKPYFLSSPYILLAYVGVLAAALGQLVDQGEGIVVDFVGESRSGKTTVLRVGQSTFTRAKDDQDVLTVNNTAGWFFELIPHLAGIPLILGDPKASKSDKFFADMRTFAFNSVAGFDRKMKGETVSVSTGYLVTLLSSEDPICEPVKGKNGSLPGELARVIQMPVPLREAGGVLGDAAKRGDVSYSQLNEILKRQHGMVLPLWFAKLGKNREKLPAAVAKRSQSAPDFFRTSDDFEQSILDKLQFLYVTGLIAITLKMLPIKMRDLDQSFNVICDAALSFLHGTSEVQLRKKEGLRDVLQKDQRIVPATIGDLVNPPSDLIGIVRQEKDGRFWYLYSRKVDGLDKSDPLFPYRTLIKSLAKEGKTTKVLQKGIDRMPAYKIADIDLI